MKSRYFIPILIFAPLLLRAEITPLIVQTNGTTIAGTVPTNKVFVVQHVTLCNGSSSDSSIALMITSSAGGFVRFYPQNEPVGPNGEVSVTLMKPLLIGGGASYKNSGNAGDKAFWFGVLADQSDLFVSNAGSNTPSIEEVEKTALALNLGVKMSSPRPTRLRVQDSTDLDEWEAADAVVTKDGASRLKVEVPLRSGSNKQFARVAATSPRREDQD